MSVTIKLNLSILPEPPMPFAGEPSTSGGGPFILTIFTGATQTTIGNMTATDAQIEYYLRTNSAITGYQLIVPGSSTTYFVENTTGTNRISPFIIGVSKPGFVQAYKFVSAATKNVYEEILTLPSATANAMASFAYPTSGVMQYFANQVSNVSNLWYSGRTSSNQPAPYAIMKYFEAPLGVSTSSCTSYCMTYDASCTTQACWRQCQPYNFPSGSITCRLVSQYVVNSPLFKQEVSGGTSASPRFSFGVDENGVPQKTACSTEYEALRETCFSGIGWKISGGGLLTACTAYTECTSFGTVVCMKNDCNSYSCRLNICTSDGGGGSCTTHCWFDCSSDSCGIAHLCSNYCPSDCCDNLIYCGTLQCGAGYEAFCTTNECDPDCPNIMCSDCDMVCFEVGGGCLRD